MAAQKEQETPLEYAERTREGIAGKANRDKRLTTILFFLVFAGTVSTPVVILTLPDPFSKVVPAVVSAIAAFATGWIQLRKPQERWAIYRTAQREVEFEIDQYQFRNGAYGDPA